MIMSFIYIAEIIIFVAIIASIAHKVGPAENRPDWLYRLQYLAVFSGAYLIIQLANAAIFLTVATILTCTIHLFSVLKAKYIQTHGHHEESILTEISKDIWLFLLVFALFRALVYDYSPVPSGSMEPTLVAGDLLAINKTAYQAIIPPFKTSLYRYGKPQRGDVIIFNSPLNPMQFYVKRVIAVGGDHVLYQNKQYYINGKAIPQTDFKYDYHENDSSIKKSWLTTATEKNGGHEYKIQIDNRRFDKPIEANVPENMYFVSGDNRDYSLDSRIFGPIPENSIVGQATYRITQFTLPTLLSFNRSGKIE